MAVEEELKQQLELRTLKITNRSYRKMLQELGKPKKATTAYFLFRFDSLKAGYTDLSIKEKWAKMDETKRRPYTEEYVKRHEIFK